jgi:hypothetical protein
MKDLIKILGLILFLGLFQTCTINEPEIKKAEQVTFSLTAKGENGGRISGATLPAGTTALLSIQAIAGVSVLSNKTVTLLSFGDSYITSPIELIPGDYKITDFMLVNSTGQVIYAAPKIGSPLAALVSSPLPTQFSVTENNVTNVGMQVVNVKTKKPEDFGYVSFGVETVELLNVSVFIKTSTGLALTTADAYIVKDDRDTLQTYSLKAEVNSLPFTEDPTATYKLVIGKSGYARYAKTFRYDSLVASIEGNMIKAVLEPAFTFFMFRDVGSSLFFRMGAEVQAKIFVDWGDGTPQQTINLTNEYELNHNALSRGKYFVSITGDIDKITSCSLYYYNFTDFDVTNLTGLKSFDSGFIWGQTTYDFSRNVNLEYLEITWQNATRNVILPKNNKIKIIRIGDIPVSDSLGGPFNPESLADVIDKLYISVVASNRRDGNATFNKGDPYLSSAPFLTPLSTESLAKLRALKNNFGWTILPDPN